MSEEIIHRLRRLVLHVPEDVGVAPKRHGRILVAEHLRDLVKWASLLEGVGAGGVPEVVGADVWRQIGLGQESM